MTAQECPRVYVASLSDYNAGRLHGVWINAKETLSIHYRKLVATQRFRNTEVSSGFRLRPTKQ